MKPTREHVAAALDVIACRAKLIEAEVRMFDGSIWERDLRTWLIALDWDLKKVRDLCDKIDEVIYGKMEE